MLGGFSKLLFGGSLLAGTCVSLGISALTSKQLEDTKLETKEGSGYTEFNLTNSSESDANVSETERQESSSPETKGLETQTSVSTEEEAKQPKHKKGCTIHQLESSSKRIWEISKIGTWEDFLKSKNKSRENINSQVIKNKCDESKGGDILVVNLKWGWFSKRWDYSPTDQESEQFREYLKKQKGS
ncbi:hypothetical protein MHC_02365 [Mycoplasma haemocanis str. Illinois]|uniref:Uncharacterized protein n=1 Tax=Mycoplasma haemocanis (strain Illinois) TaxID=1111676 RepID=H6N6R5_MYCHN|nr:hypothetical protein [Mycoplasma haemocanis]AEW45337.1 hypothetical protein MHC_02365 [Mycoplasma haemocanis str. Illinois]